VTLRRFGVETTFVTSSDPADYAAAITEKTKLVFVETVSNPSGAVADLEGLADVAHAAGVPLIVDSTIPTPYLNRPIEWGADVVIHSATKFLGGHGTTLGGVVVESGRFHWASERFPLFDEAVPHYGGLNWHGNFGEYAFLTRLRSEQLRDVGPTLAPHSAFLLAQGVETLPYRIQAHVDNARAVAEWLEADPRIEYVNWAGLASHEHHDRAAKYLPKGPGSVFSFGVTGGRSVGQTFIESVDLASHVANIGDAKTLVIHPGSTTHAQLTEQQLAEAGVDPGLVRISVGIEDVDDIIYDLDQALDAAVKG
jgi:O-acetylhomoserine (thiol)-lyase